MLYVIFNSIYKIYIKREFVPSGGIILFGLSNNNCLILGMMRAWVVAQSMRLHS